MFLWFSYVVGKYLVQPAYWDASWDVLRVFEIFHLNQKGNTKKDDILEQAFISSLINWEGILNEYQNIYFKT